MLAHTLGIDLDRKSVPTVSIKELRSLDCVPDRGYLLGDAQQAIAEHLGVGAHCGCSVGACWLVDTGSTNRAPRVIDETGSSFSKGCVPLSNLGVLGCLLVGRAVGVRWLCGGTVNLLTNCPVTEVVTSA